MTSEEIQGFVGDLQALAVKLMPDERAVLRQPTVQNDILHVNVVVRSGRYYFGWSIPAEILGNEDLIADSLTDAVSRAGLAGIVYVIKPEPSGGKKEAKQPEKGEMTTPPTPIIPPAPPEPLVDDMGNPVEVEPMDYESKTKAELIAEVERRGLTATEGDGSGKDGVWLKADYVQFLKDDDAAPVEHE